MQFDKPESTIVIDKIIDIIKSSYDETNELMLSREGISSPEERQYFEGHLNAYDNLIDNLRELYKKPYVHL